MNTINIIFLNFDGVITSRESDYKLSPELLERLGQLIESTDARLVISSSWRGLDKESTIEQINDASNPAVGNVPFPFTDRILGVTPRCGAWMRGQEIEEWFRTHRRHLENVGIKEISYVILDDIDDFYVQQKEHLVKTLEVIGLQDNDIKKAKEILNKKILINDTV